MSTNLLEQTLDMVRESPLSIPQIAVAADVDQRWLYMLVSGKIKDPGIKRITRLHDYLLGDARPGRERAA